MLLLVIVVFHKIQCITGLRGAHLFVQLVDFYHLYEFRIDFEELQMQTYTAHTEIV